MIVTVVRGTHEFIPRLEIKVIRCTTYGVGLEATSNFFPGTKSEFFGPGDTWNFEIPDKDIQEYITKMKGE